MTRFLIVYVHEGCFYHYQLMAADLGEAYLTFINREGANPQEEVYSITTAR